AEVIDLDFGYDPSRPVLKDINVVLDKPEFVCIMGPNGVGKSTLIHCMNRILKFTEGTIMIEGHDTKDMKLKQLASHMGYVPASSEDSFPLTVVDTIMVGLQNDFKFGTSDDDLRRVNETLRMMKIEHLAMRNFNELSAGQHQKVMLARGLVRTPRIVLLDEPTSNLDIKHQIDVTKTLSLLPKAKGMLVIMISHDINITAKYADRIIMLSGGGVYADGTPEEVLTKENLKVVYGVDADIIQVAGRPHIILNDCFDEAYIPTDMGPVE
ncbi:MAG: ABC transporter ATP-binding protein, partial [Candidatus Methanomethylophilaceae archaeon]|nr:ABC transporter ATP-binding protein [Candidatus Methanomethylophilaceae archaeon]